MRQVLYVIPPIGAKNVEEALGDESLTTTLQEELNQFTRNDVWYLVLKPKGTHRQKRLIMKRHLHLYLDQNQLGYY